MKCVFEKVRLHITDFSRKKQGKELPILPILANLENIGTSPLFLHLEGVGRIEHAG